MKFEKKKKFNRTVSSIEPYATIPETFTEEHSQHFSHNNQVRAFKEIMTINAKIKIRCVDVISFEYSSRNSKARICEPSSLANSYWLPMISEFFSIFRRQLFHNSLKDSVMGSYQAHLSIVWGVFKK